MKLSVLPDTDKLVIRIDEPRIDAAIATQFKDAMRRLINQQDGTVLLDMEQVDFMDSSGLGAVISVYKSLPPGRGFELRHLTPNVDRVFRLTRMDSVFTIHPQAPA
ncbi:MAG: STAS domain-containing protein [Paracoccus sp. (in: a-proteobacteria)]|uniref:STAS domain-containing protein n=1 Tax=Paracoccus sp. TaxID=267 RepID=UPI0026E011F4|nr:STAS domain-containing protein [Paracoccus sp. (in: a-proteobacteria)]MDO5621262.1 STAS domain-containing protein [Paracoccus sp. (in: a-proteobacteria)]